LGLIQGYGESGNKISLGVKTKLYGERWAVGIVWDRYTPVINMHVTVILGWV